MLLAPAVLSVLLALAAGCVGDGSGDTSDVVARIPFTAGERMAYELRDNTGEIVARGILSTHREGARLVLEQAYRQLGEPQGVAPATDTVAVTVDALTLKPSSGSRLITQRDPADDMSVEEYEWRYVAEQEHGALAVTRQRAEKTEERDLNLREHHYDNESSLWLWRTLDLAGGYEARYVSVNHLDASQQTVTVRVTRRETLEVPAGTFETWRLLVRTGRATRVAWISVASPHELVQWDNGSLVFRLAESGGVER